jgi:hypothetical protein
MLSICCLWSCMLSVVSSYLGRVVASDSKRGYLCLILGSCLYLIWGVTETSKLVNVLLLLGGKQHSYAWGHMLCLHYTLCLMQLSVVRNLILVEFSDLFATSGLLVIDAVGWRSMYLVVMPRVNLIVILSSYAYCLYSINFPTVICLPSMYYFILWRDTTSELWILVLYPLYCHHLFTLLAYYYHFPLDTLIPFVSSKPVRLTTSS